MHVLYCTVLCCGALYYSENRVLMSYFSCYISVIYKLLRYRLVMCRSSHCVTHTALLISILSFSSSLHSGLHLFSYYHIFMHVHSLGLLLKLNTMFLKVKIILWCTSTPPSLLACSVRVYVTSMRPVPYVQYRWMLLL